MEVSLKRLVEKGLSLACASSRRDVILVLVINSYFTKTCMVCFKYMAQQLTYHSNVGNRTQVGAVVV